MAGPSVESSWLAVAELLLHLSEAAGKSVDGRSKGKGDKDG